MPITDSPVSFALRGALRLLVAAALSVALTAPASLSAQTVEKAPTVILDGIPFSVTIAGDSTRSVEYEIRTAKGVSIASGTIAAEAEVEVTGLVVESRDELPLEVHMGGTTESVSATFTPGWFALAPPIVAIALALIFKEVLTALFAGVWLGALAMMGWNPLAATARVIDTFAVPALVADGHAQIVVFSFLLGGMVGVIGRNGGTRGIVERLAPVASTPRRGKLATWAAGMAVFFDDYANTLIVGNTMRPITDRLRISREKLAYLVDSTAAPIAALVPISTWVGYEISLIAGGLESAAQQTADPALAGALQSVSPFALFINTIPYLFYPLLAITFVFLTSLMNRDWGTMAVAEARAIRGGGVFRRGATLTADTEGAAIEAKDGVETRWWNAAIPVLTVVAVVLAGLHLTGRASTESGASLFDIFGAADPFSALLWGSLAGCLVAIVLSLGQRILTLRESMEAMMGGMKAMFLAMVILILAWSLGAATEEVGTTQYLSSTLNDVVPLHFLPVLVFVISAAIAFATGTSWGTMGILLPIVIPLTVSLGGAEAADGGVYSSIMLGAISSVLAGAIFGDHCSPISDTTVLSSMASGCDHMDHVRTQLPYALLVAVVAMSVGDIPTAFGFPSWISLVAGAGILYLFLRLRGVPLLQRKEDSEAAT